MKTSFPPLPLRAPRLAPGSMVSSSFHRGRAGGQRRDGVRRGTEPPTPKVQQNVSSASPTRSCKRASTQPSPPPPTPSAHLLA